MHLFLPGPAGRLEAILDAPAAPRAVAVVCHPHPLFGGTLQTNVVHRIARGFEAAGAAALRFNFRGVGRSEGRHDRGRGELGDVAAALAFAAERYPGLPLWLGGFSFGAYVGGRVAAGDPRVVRMVLAGLPLERPRAVAIAVPELPEDWEPIRAAPQPKLIVQGAADEFGDRAAIERFAATVRPPVRLVVIDGANHLFDGHVDEVGAAVSAFASGD